jgi:hypothetical protein
MGVPHRHGDIGMTGEPLRLGEASTVTDQLGDVGVPAGRVEVRDSLGCFVVDSDSLKILFHHEPGASFLKSWEKKLLSCETFEPSWQYGNELGVKRQHILATML